MKRSQTVQLTLLASVASLLINCDNRPTRYCVDENQRVSDDWNCTDDSGHHGVSSHGHHWYYSSLRGPFANGARVASGSATSPSQGFVTPSRASTTGSTRGVIGSAGEAASAGHAGGSGHGGGE